MKNKLYFIQKNKYEVVVWSLLNKSVYVMRCAIRYQQFKKREKHPWRNVKNLQLH